MAALISEIRVLEYEERGFLDVERLLTPDEVAEIGQRIDDIAEGRVPGFPDANIELEPSAGGVRSARSVRKINHIVENDPLIRKYARLDRILDIVEAIVGPEIKLFESQLFMKPPGGVEKPYHQDSAYFTIEPMSLVTCWIALDEVTIENGCLWVVPGSHRLGVLPHTERWMLGDREDKRVPESAFDRSREVPIVLSPGSCSFHHSLLLHMSHPNNTQTWRRGLAIHYMSAKSRWTDATQPQPQYILLRGREYPGCV